jgi:hypothetical protein
VIRRRNDAEQQYWLGQLEGLDLTLDHLRRTRANTRRLVERLPSDDPFVGANVVDGDHLGHGR